MKAIHGALGVVAVLAASTMLTGCGADGPSDDPTESAEYFLTALGEGDTAKMCEVSAYYSERYTGPVDDQNWPSSDCEADINEDYGDLLGDEDFTEITVEKATVEGAEAEAEAEDLKGLPIDTNYGLKMQRFDDKWYVIPDNSLSH